MNVRDLILALQLEAADLKVYDYEVDVPTTAYGSVENDIINRVEVDHETQRVTLS